MDGKNGFCWHKHVHPDSGLEFIILGYNGEGQLYLEKEAWILPAIGSNLCRFAVAGKNIIDFDIELLLKNDYTGTPVLYPTPNRVRNGIFMYKEKAYHQVKRGAYVLEHGLVHNEKWEYSDPEVKSDGVYLHTWIDFNKDNKELFGAFPFNHRLGLEFYLSRESIKVTYTISNFDNEDIPYGFGLHPYFMKISGGQDTYVSLPASAVMDYTSDLLPTGRLIDVDRTIYDLRSPTKIDSLDMDHVFTKIIDGRFAEIDYSTSGIQVAINSTGDFSHLVLYSARGENYFCLESQTCSTDAHNLHYRGFTIESGLKSVPAGKVKSGSVEYKVKSVAI